MGVRKCVDCKGKVSDAAAACPHCGSTKPAPAKAKVRWGRWVLAGLLGLYCAGRGTPDAPVGGDAAASKHATAPAAERKSKAAEVQKASAPPPRPKPKTQAELEQERLVARFGPPPVPSSWDGTYREVEKYLEAIARDPDSVELDGCTEVRRSSDGWVVGCNWRGRNGFGGMNREANWFTIMGGRVVQMHEYAAFRE